MTITTSSRIEVRAFVGTRPVYSCTIRGFSIGELSPGTYIAWSLWPIATGVALIA